MKTAAIVSTVLAYASVAFGHGLVTDISVDGTVYGLYNPYGDPYKNPKPARAGWTVPGNGPVEDVITAAIACNGNSKAGSIYAKASAGSSIKFFWTEWPTSHRGPTMTYLANCGGDCTTADVTSLDFFKINEAGLNSDGTWASDDVIANNNTWTVTVPSDIKAGNYVLRHELLALHGAASVNGAQFYPVCVNLEVDGTGSAVPTDTVKFPGGYKAADPGIQLNIYYPKPTSYVIPGPPVYGSGSASPSASAPASSSAASKTSVKASSVKASSTVRPGVAYPTGTGFATGIHLGGGAAPEPTKIAVVSAPTLGEDGIVTATVAVPQVVTTTIAQTIQMTLTQTAFATQTVTVTAKASAAPAAECTPAARRHPRALWW